MKLKYVCEDALNGGSRPARGAWVEILTAHKKAIEDQGRAPQGARGLKWFNEVNTELTTAKSRPARGAWVEICPKLISEGLE